MEQGDMLAWEPVSPHAKNRMRLQSLAHLQAPLHQRQREHEQRDPEQGAPRPVWGISNSIVQTGAAAAWDCAGQAAGRGPAQRNAGSPNNREAHTMQCKLPNSWSAINTHSGWPVLLGLIPSCPPQSTPSAYFVL